MKKIIVAGLSALFVSLFVTSESRALDYCNNVSIVTLVPANSTNDTAHLIYVAGGSCPASQGSPALCSGNRAFIDLNDKALFALALAARIENVPVNFSYDVNSSPAKGSAVHGVIPCKVTSLWR